VKDSLSFLLIKLCVVGMLPVAMAAHADDAREAMQQSAFVGVVTISSGDLNPSKDSEQSNCGAAYTAYAGAKRVFVNDIDWVEGSPIEFRASEALDLGGTYLVYLTHAIVEPISHAGLIDRDLRTSRCIGAGVDLVPVLVKVEHWHYAAVFPKWRLATGTNDRGEIEHRFHFLAIADMQEFFSLPDSDFPPIEAKSLDVQKPVGLVSSAAFDSDELLDLLRDVSCDLRKSSPEPANELQIAKCP